jgi:hypothetical protein
MQALLAALLLPAALATGPLAPHHQQIVDKFGVENVSFDKNVRKSYCGPCGFGRYM